MRIESREEPEKAAPGGSSSAARSSETTATSGCRSRSSRSVEQGLDQALVIFIASLLADRYHRGRRFLARRRPRAARRDRRVTLLPVTWALVVALVVRNAGWHRRPHERDPALADAAVPLVLLCLGLQLGQNLRIHDQPVLLSVGLRLVVVPLAAIVVGRLAGLSRPHPAEPRPRLRDADGGQRLHARARVQRRSEHRRERRRASSTFTSIPLIAFVVTVLPAL